MSPTAQIPLRPDRKVLHRDARRTVSRVVAALAYAELNQSTYPADYLKRHWREDDDALRVLKAVSSPTDTSSFWTATPSRLLPALMPSSAAGALMGRGKTVSLSGVNAVKLPYIGSSGRPPTVPFVGEGQPAPVVNMTSSSLTLGPTKKLLIIGSLTEEIELVTAGTASQIVSTALDIAATQQIDAQLFSATAPSASAPGGLLNGVAALTSAGGTGATGLADDIGKLSLAIAQAGIDTSELTIITDAGSASKIEILSSPKFTERVLPSAVIPSGTVIAIAAQGFYTAYGDTAISIEVSKQTTLHFESANPLPLAGNTGTLAYPTQNLFQQALLAFKLRAPMTWITHPGAVAWMQGCAW